VAIKEKGKRKKGVNEKGTHTTGAGEAPQHDLLTKLIEQKHVKKYEVDSVCVLGEGIFKLAISEALLSKIKPLLNQADVSLPFFLSALEFQYSQTKAKLGNPALVLMAAARNFVPDPNFTDYLTQELGKTEADVAKQQAEVANDLRLKVRYELVKWLEDELQPSGLVPIVFKALTTINKTEHMSDICQTVGMQLSYIADTTSTTFPPELEGEVVNSLNNAKDLIRELAKTT